MNDTAVKLTGVGKKYLVSHQKPTLIGNVLGKKSTETFWALKDIDLKIRKGERVGIIGPNGAGKTTLLKIISQITTPTEGKIQTQGKVVTLMNLEAGFHPDLTGEENIFINGMLAGMTRDEIKKKYNKIVKFADIGDFIDAPFYTYSLGMKFRLGFAIAISSECDLLVIDEIFVVGDADFQEKTFDEVRIVQKKGNVTTVVASHLATLVRAFSDTFYLIEKGIVRQMTNGEMNKLVRSQDNRWRKRTKL